MLPLTAQSMLLKPLGSFREVPAHEPVVVLPLPPPPEPVLGKPVLFDLALAHVQFPPLQPRAAPKQEGRSGLFGWFRR
ncbi:MAG: hypothetical protein ACK4ZJ_16655 [Allorhizobium sp.]